MKGDRVTFGEDLEKTVVLTPDMAAERYEKAVNAVNVSHYGRGKRIGIMLGIVYSILFAAAVITLAIAIR